MIRLRAVMPILLLGATPTIAQTPQSHHKATEQVVIQYEKLVANGAFLTPEGWKTAGTLFDRSNAFPRRGTISIMSTGGALGEIWLRDDRAEVETKWTDFFGTIDSRLRYKPPPIANVTMTTYVFHLIHTNKHRYVGASGETIREMTGPWTWKIEDPHIAQWTTLNGAIKYVSLMRDKSDDSFIRNNADKTIAALKRLGKGCGSASAC